MDLAIRDADNLRIRFAETGKGGSETVVLTSPWPESVLAFRKVWDRLAEQFHLIAIDLPGFGQSERQFELYSTTAMGGFLAQLMRQWHLDPVHLVSPDVGTQPPCGWRRMIRSSCAASLSAEAPWLSHWRLGGH